MGTADDIIAAKRRVQARLLALPGVIGVGVGPKLARGGSVQTLAIVVTVQAKRPPDTLPFDQIIPATLEGHPTDVVEGTLPVLIAATPADSPAADDSQYPVLRAGIQIDTPAKEVAGGTLGCIARTHDTPPRFVLVTNAHILHGKGHDLSPGCGHSIGQPSGHTCCECMDGLCNLLHLSHIVAHERRPAVVDHGVDAGTAELIEGTQWLPEVQDEPNPVPITDVYTVQPADIDPQNVFDDAHRYKVWKRGRSTRRTGGWIHQLDYVGRDANGNLDPRYDNVIMVLTESPSFTEPGDSGAPLLSDNDGDRNRLVGIVFAQGNFHDTLVSPPRIIPCGFASPIDRVQTALGVDVMTLDNSPAGVQTVGKQSPRPMGDFPRLPTALPPNGTPQPDDPVLVGERAAAARSAARLLAALVPQQLAVAVRRHRDEVGRLAALPRMIAAWRRYGGAAALDALQRLTAGESDATPSLPAQLAGRPFADCVRRFAAELHRHAGADLWRDAERFVEPLSELGGLTYTEMLPRLDRDLGLT